MSSVSIPLILVGFGVVGCILLGFVIGLGNHVTSEYVDYNLPGNPIVQEYDFRIGGKYGLITVTLLVGGLVLAIGGNASALKMLYSNRQLRHPEEKDGRPETTTEPSLRCPKCNKHLPIYSQFCPRCGTDL